jgi:O-acetyl-ADP-ribose deacetylase (regulator of RNase III)
MTELRVELGDITTQSVDVIVNAAKSSLMGGGGVDGAIHRAAGPSVLEECKAIVDERGGCPAGEAVMTGAGTLEARCIIHTVGPIWTGAEPDEDDRLLALCYSNSLGLAADSGLSTIAFPNISTGVYRFPKPRAAAAAISAVQDWVCSYDEVISSITFVCFDEDNLYEYRRLLS